MTDFQGSTSTNQSAVSAARADILEKIRSLKTSFNKLAPINHLPFELLTVIFKYAIANSTTRSESDYEDPNIYVIETFARDRWGKIRDISHVCRHWQSAALGCPSLWSQIDFGDPAPAVEKMLTRSRPSLISVTIGGLLGTGTEHITDSLASKILDVNRLGSLRLSLPPRGIKWGLDIIRSSGSSAPHMTSVFINDLWSLRRRTRQPPIMEWISMPQLQHLELSSCNVAWNSAFQFTSLVSLRLFHIWNPPIEPFFALLASNPNLKTLRLEASLPKLPSNRPATHSVKIALPKLSSCLISHSTLSQCLDFQARILYPVSTAHLDFCPSEMDPTNSTEIKSFISSFNLEEPTDGPRRSCLLLDARFSTPIMIFSRLPCHIQRCMTTVHGYTPHPDDSSSVRLDMDKCTSSDWYSHRNEHPRWLDMLSVSGLKRLVIYSLPDSCDVNLECLDFFKRNPEITHFTLVDRKSAERILTALLGCDLEAVFRSCLPELTTLTLQRCGDNTGCDPEKFVESPEFAPLCRFLSERRKCGLRVERLELIDFAELDKAAIKVLEVEVGEVVWDDAARVAVKKVAEVDQTSKRDSELPGDCSSDEEDSDEDD